jgi:uncharacterized protein (DUF2267 family)
MAMKSDVNQATAESDQWLDCVAEHLCFTDRRDAHTALTAVLHALRDRLPREGAAHFGTLLPAAIGSGYFEGCLQSAPIKGDRSVQEFCEQIGRKLPPNFPLDAKNIAKGIFDVLLEQLDHGETAEVLAALPKPLQALWAKTARNFPRSGSGGCDACAAESAVLLPKGEPFEQGPPQLA